MTQAWDFIDADLLWWRHDDFLDRRIDEIDWNDSERDTLGRSSGIGVRVANVFRDAGIVTVRDLFARSDRDLLLANFGSKSMRAVKRVLREHGLELRARE